MKHVIIAAVSATLLAAPAIAADEKIVRTETVERVVSAEGDRVEAPDSDAARIVAECGARKFETSVEIERDGQKRVTKLKLCADKDEDQATWLKTLEDAKGKIVGHPDISDDSKAKIAAELDAEIARLKGAN